MQYVFFVFQGEKLSGNYNNHENVTLYLTLWVSPPLFGFFWSDIRYIHDINILPRCKKVCLSSPGLNDDIMNNDLSLVRYIKHKQHNERQSSLFPAFCEVFQFIFAFWNSPQENLTLPSCSLFISQLFLNLRKKKKRASEVHFRLHSSVNGILKTSEAPFFFVYLSLAPPRSGLHSEH